jgi:tetratricopeptide (TPR) repeat protein
MNNLNENSVNKIYNEGQNHIKTSYFKFKFSPDYLSAVSCFTDAAAGYRKLKMFNQSLQAYEDAIKCNKQLLESWQEGQNWQEMADICIFDMNDFTNGWNYLKNSSLSYKIAGKFTSGIKVYNDFAQRLIEINRSLDAVKILREAIDDCFEHTHDELIRISLEEVFNKILDVYCQIENFVNAIELIEKYIKLQKTLKNEAKHKISKNYVKLGMLRIIIGELYMSENLINDMFSSYDSSCSDDIDDLRKLNKCFKDGNKKEFNFLVTYAFSLFQNNLLKALKKSFDKSLEERMNLQDLNLNSNQIIDLNLIEAVSTISLDETKANSEIGKDETNANNNLVNGDDYL